MKRRVVFANLFVAFKATFALLILVTASVFAQETVWRPIDHAGLSATVSKVEKEADAEILLWEVRIEEHNIKEFELRHYVSVKIYTQRGREKYSKIQIPYAKGQKVKNFAVRVIKKNGSIVEIGNADIFEQDLFRTVDTKVRVKSVAVPSVEAGVVVEYQYTESIDKRLASRVSLDLQADVPIQTLNYYYKTSFREPSYRTFNIPDLKFIKDKDGYFLATRSNVPAFEVEPFMPPAATVRPWVRIGVGRVEHEGTNEQSSFGRYMKNESRGLRKVAAEITAGASIDDEKIKRLFDYCQNKISNTDFRSAANNRSDDLIDETSSLKDVIDRGFGTSASINLLFGAMAIASGFDARVAFLSDRSKILSTSEAVSGNFFHLGAIGIRFGNDWKFFNPGNQFLPFGKLLWHEEDGFVRLADGTNIVVSNTPVTDQSDSYSKRTGKFVLLENGTLDGEVTIELNGHLAISYRMNSINETAYQLEDKLKAEFQRNISWAEVTRISIENLNDISKPVVQRFHVKVANYAEKTGKRLIFQPGFFEYGSSPMFSSENRRYDIFFRHPWGEHDLIQITFPENYAIDNGASPISLSDGSKIIADDISIRFDSSISTIYYKRDFYIGGQGKVHFDVRAYPAIKNLLDRIHKSDTYQLSLKQK